MNDLFEFFASRLNKDKNGGAWCPKDAVNSDSSEWIQVDLKSVHKITAVVTQVRLKFAHFDKIF